MQYVKDIGTLIIFLQFYSLLSLNFLFLSYFLLMFKLH